MGKSICAHGSVKGHDFIKGSGGRSFAYLIQESRFFFLLLKPAIAEIGGLESNKNWRQERHARDGRKREVFFVYCQ